MTIANIYRKLKQILNDSNVSLGNRNLNRVNTLNEIVVEIDKLGEINRLPYFLKKDVVGLIEEDLKDIISINRWNNLHRYNLTNVTIPDSVTTIGDGAFSSCSNLFDIYLKSTIPPALYNASSINSQATIHVPVGSGDAYKTATNWSELASRIVEDIVIN